MNGRDFKAGVTDGYITINKVWAQGDKVELDFPMKVRQIKAIDKVEDNRGKLAIERGPIIYCLEGKDQNDSNVFNKFIPEGTKFESSYEKDLLSGVVTLTADVKKLEKDGSVSDVSVKAIPYSTWNNRGADQMAVWIADNAELARPEPEATIASKARSFMFQQAIQKDAPISAATETWAWGVNDQWEPKSSCDISKPYHYWWLKHGTLETIAYEFEKSETVSCVDVYWLDFAHYDGDFRIPESWKLYYKEKGEWKEVENVDPYIVKKDCYNTVQFKPVETSGLKIEAQLQKNASGGILEWKVR